MADRLQKWLAARGHGSRREIERLIQEGRILVDGSVAEVGCKVTGSETIKIDGRAIRQSVAELPSRTLIYNKPAGEICSRSDPQGRPTVFAAMPKVIGARWVSVGRLDLQTTGLLLLTTDGELANQLMHPSAEIPREYIVRALGELSPQQLKQLQSGVELEDGRACFDEIEITRGDSANRSYRVVVSEGRNRIVRRLFDKVDCRVNRLMRVRFGPLTLPRDLRPGQYRELTAAEIERLRNDCAKT